MRDMEAGLPIAPSRDASPRLLVFLWTMLSSCRADLESSSCEGEKSDLATTLTAEAGLL